MIGRNQLKGGSHTLSHMVKTTKMLSAIIVIRRGIRRRTTTSRERRKEKKRRRKGSKDQEGSSVKIEEINAISEDSKDGDISYIKLGWCTSSCYR